MTPEEAMKVIGDWCANETFKRTYKSSDIRLLSDGLGVLKKMVEKQIPKKLIHNGTENFVRDNCPACGRLFGIRTMGFTHCPDCGQAIDYSKEETP